MSSATKATFVLVPGVYHTVAHAQALVDSLHAKGHPAEAISHPSIGELASSVPPDADAANLRQVLEKLINNEEKDIILFCHSYGGVPGSQSIHGLERSARAKADQKGGISKVIYLSAILPREGESLLQTLTEAEIPRADWAEMSVGGENSGESYADLASSPQLAPSAPTPKLLPPSSTICLMTRLSIGPQN